jgi:hypothetical protein
MGKLAAASLVLSLGALTAAQDRPLPDQESFLREVRRHLQTDQTLQSSYSYVERRRELKLDKQGRRTVGSEKVFESYPGFPGEERWERLIEENGVPVPAKKLEEQDRERQSKAAEHARRLATNPKKEHARQVRAYEERRREMSAAVEDVFRVYDVTMLRREAIDGHDTIAFSLRPRRDAKPQTRDGGLMRNFEVLAWVSESDHELVRLDVEAMRTVKIGLGLLARIHKGARLSFFRRKVNGEAWLPATYSYFGSARVGLIANLRREGTSEFSNYRKFSVDTASTFAVPASPGPTR